MTAYITIADSEIDPESPGTTTLFTKLRDNPIATYEGNNSTKIVDSALSSPGSLKLIETQTASASATIDFITGINSTYDTYIVKFSDVIPAINGTSFEMRVSTDGGANFLIATNYHYATSEKHSDGTATDSLNSVVSSVILLVNDADSNVNYGVNGSLEIHNPSSTTGNIQSIYDLSYFHQSNACFTKVDGMGVYSAAGDVDAVRFLQGTGNIASGTISLYGVVK